ncbi:MAG: DUF4296 domain-containing protein [Bacteroidota bacterium]
MRAFLTGLLLATPLFLGGCSAFTADSPPLPDSTMVRLLIELHLADGRAQVEQDLTLALRDSIFLYYGVDRLDYEATLDYYADQPEAYVTLYEQVLDSLNAQRGSFNRPAPTPPPASPTPPLQGRIAPD